MVYFNEDIYEGEWENDKKNGKGRLEHINEGIVYIGEFIEDKKTGKGRLYSKKKDEIYEGEWANDKKNGEGTTIMRNGEVTSGDFRNDMMEGKLKHEQSLNRQEVEKYFSLAFKTSDHFIEAKP